LDKAFSRVGRAQSIGAFQHIPEPMSRRQQREALMIQYSATVVVNPRDFEVQDAHPGPDMTTK
jgi:hypothetical protein